MFITQEVVKAVIHPLPPISLRRLTHNHPSLNKIGREKRPSLHDCMEERADLQCSVEDVFTETEH